MSDTTRAVSPPTGASGVKRERSDDEEEEETRRVSQRTDDTSSSWTASNDITKYVKEIACSTEKESIVETMKKLKVSLRGTNERRQQNFLRFGGPLTIVAAMEKYPGCQSLQYEGTGVFVNASTYNADAHSIVTEVGGIHAILLAMKRFPRSEEMQRYGAIALNNFSAGCRTQDAMVLALETDGFACVTRAMKTFPDHFDIVSYGCKVLFNLSKIEILKKPMRNTNVRTALAIAMDGHKDDEEIQKWGGKALKLLL